MPGPAAETPAFPLTRWTLVSRASSESCDVARQQLCQLYWYPLYAWARSRGEGPEDAEDLTQAFFQRLLEGNMLAAADRGVGKMRSFLLKAFEYDLIDERRRRTRLKRGGGIPTVQLDAALAERLLLTDQAIGEPSLTYDRAWVATVFRTALASVKADYLRRGQDATFALLRPWLDGSHEELAASDSAKAADLSPTVARQAIHRLRERFRVAVRRVIADTLESPDEASIEAEFQAFAAILTNAGSGS